MKDIIESEKSSEEIVSELTEQVEKFQGLAIDTNYWTQTFGLGDFEDDVEEYNLDLRKVKQAADAIHKQGMRLVGGSPEQKLYTKGSTFVVEVDRDKTTFSFGERPKFNCHVAFFAMENGDPTRHLTESES